MSNSLPENFEYLCLSIEHSSNGLSIQESNSNHEKTNNQPFIKEEPIIDPSTSQKTVSRQPSGVSRGSFQEEEKESGNRKFAQRRKRVDTETEKVL